MSIHPHDFDDAQLNRELAEQVGDISAQELEREMATAQPPRSSSHHHHAPGENATRVSGRILSISGPDVFVDIGGKSEGVLPLD